MDTTIGSQANSPTYFRLADVSLYKNTINMCLRQLEVRHSFPGTSGNYSVHRTVDRWRHVPINFRLVTLAPLVSSTHCAVSGFG